MWKRTLRSRKLCASHRHTPDRQDNTICEVLEPRFWTYGSCSCLLRWLMLTSRCNHRRSWKSGARAHSIAGWLPKKGKNCISPTRWGRTWYNLRMTGRDQKGVLRKRSEFCKIHEDYQLIQLCDYLPKIREIILHPFNITNQFPRAIRAEYPKKPLKQIRNETTRFLCRSRSEKTYYWRVEISLWV